VSVNLKWLAQSTIYRDSVDLLAVLDYGNGERHVAKAMDFTLERHEPHTIYGEPTLAISPQSARSLMQALWDAGIRPEDANLSSPAEVTALKNHIRFAEGVAESLLTRVEPGFAGSAPVTTEK
jgi:hypothetical protein